MTDEVQTQTEGTEEVVSTEAEAPATEATPATDAE